jgi:hypothetical protein
MGSLGSFMEVCGPDSNSVCHSSNPFAATFCLVSNKPRLSPNCQDYVTAKVNCYIAAAKRCEDLLLACLYRNRRATWLPHVCTQTSFFDYVKHGPTAEDLNADRDAS